MCFIHVGRLNKCKEKENRMDALLWKRGGQTQTSDVEVGGSSLVFAVMLFPLARTLPPLPSFSYDFKMGNSAM